MFWASASHTRSNMPVSCIKCQQICHFVFSPFSPIDAAKCSRTDISPARIATGRSAEALTQLLHRWGGDPGGCNRKGDTVLYVLRFTFFFTDSFVSEQHPPAVTHDPSGHSWADPRLWPLPGPCGLVQQLQTSGLFRGKVLVVLLFFLFSFYIILSQHFFPRKIKAFILHFSKSSLDLLFFKIVFFPNCLSYL